MTIAILASIVTSPLAVILLLIFNETIFPASSGSLRAEERAMKFESEKKKKKARDVADLTWNVYGDAEEVGDEEDVRTAGGCGVDVNHAKILTDEEYEKQRKHQF